ncbi:hypothetical protein AKJ65_03755 [candidate division MSBL1 archaeon SCGC-AAA259E19]|uniref:ATP-grasp domain-containing protein n=1 Tax=candidate division MSBL1 archaeon SCGC-AAA259E19 TaxID=1698264 RepID=A0A133UKD0_9EURY|nr:hypothetical protein AKJ65_03755 [candidate division MSBL1 archaeon SCGC-AAA259E19]
MVINDECFFIESNPRLTTSFVGLSSTINQKLAELFVKKIVEERPISSPSLENFSRISIPRVEKDVETESEKLTELEQIPEIISPPYLVNGKVKEGSPIFLAVATGESFEEAEDKIKEVINEAINLLGIDKDAVTWA